MDPSDRTEGFTEESRAGEVNVSLAPTCAAILDHLEGDEELVQLLARAWLGEVGRVLSEAARGIREDDAELVNRSAHSLKGSAGIFSALRVVERAHLLEQSTAHHLIPSEATALLADLEEAANALSRPLRQSLDELG